MMMDWNQYHKEVGARIGDLMKVSPDTVRGYQTLSAANSKTSKLGEKTRQLISLAVAVTTRCDGCIVVHTDAALKAGATKEEISEALGVAVGDFDVELLAQPIRFELHVIAHEAEHLAALGHLIAERADLGIDLPSGQALPHPLHLRERHGFGIGHE